MGSLGYLFGAAMIDLVSGFGKAITGVITKFGGGGQRGGAESINEVSFIAQVKRLEYRDLGDAFFGIHQSCYLECS